jgi:hypothetical protein
VSGRTAASAARGLPEQPSLEHLKKQARRRLRELRAASPAAKLADAQLEIARGYGFPSWRALKAFVEATGERADGRKAWLGSYRTDPRLTSNGVVTISEAAGRLFLDAAAGARFELREAEPGRLVIAGIDGFYGFEGDEAGPARTLVQHTPGGDLRLERIPEAEARAIRAAREQAQADQARPRTLAQVTPEVLQRYVGDYVSPLGPGLEVTAKDGRLFVQVVGQPQLEVFAESETRFFYRVIPAQLEFVLEAGQVTAVMLHQSGLEQRLDRVSPEEARRTTARIREALSEQQRPRELAKIDPAVLGRYAGRYRLDPERMLVVTVEQGRLFVDITDQPRFEVHPESETTFFWTVAAAQITFMTGSDGRVTHAVLHQSGRNLPLPRLDHQGAAA